MTDKTLTRRSILKYLSAATLLSGAITAASVAQAQRVDKKDEKILIIYFSMPETDKPGDMTREEANSTVVVNGKVLGNTQYVAQLIQERTKADVFRIIPATPYPTDHDTLVDLAKEEQNRAARPAIGNKINNLAQYDTVFIGYPNWWADMPIILYTLFDQYDFSGKKLIPFNTHGGSGFSDTIETIMKLEPKAQVIETGFTLSRSRMELAPERVAAWLNALGY